MKLNARIEWNPDVLAGKPVIRGTRLSVEFIVDLLAQGWTYDDVMRNYPAVQKEDIQACLQYASEVLHSEKLHPVEV